MIPILFTLGDIEISSSVFFLVLGILAGIAVGWSEARRVGIPDRLFHGLWASAVPLALLLAALNGWIFETGFAEGLRSLARADYSGLVSFGAILAALAWSYLYSKLVKIPTGLLLDGISVVLPMVLGVYRIGCILAGCCHGLETEGFLGLYLPDRGGVWANRYPTQIMLLLFNFALFGWLWSRRKRRVFDGEQIMLYLFVYSLGRLIIDALRDLPRVLGPFSLHQLTSLAILLIVSYSAFELWRERRAA
jgi:phosphatidylglycerol:prolipoprotein diacylglycerol transferase